MKTRLEFLEAHRHELMGVVCDGAMQARQGAELALFLRATMRRIDEKLSAVYDEFAREAPPAFGGAANHATNGRH